MPGEDIFLLNVDYILLTERLHNPVYLYILVVLVNEFQHEYYVISVLDMRSEGSDILRHILVTLLPFITYTPYIPILSSPPPLPKTIPCVSMQNFGVFCRFLQVSAFSSH